MRAKFKCNQLAFTKIDWWPNISTQIYFHGIDFWKSIHVQAKSSWILVVEILFGYMEIFFLLLFLKFFFCSWCAMLHVVQLVGHGKRCPWFIQNVMLLGSCCAGYYYLDDSNDAPQSMWCCRLNLYYQACTLAFILCL